MKVVGERLQNYGEQLLHGHQYRLVRGRSAVDVLYRSVVEVRACLDGVGYVWWAFWDVEGGSKTYAALRCWIGCEDVTRLECGWDGCGASWPHVS